MPKLILLWLSAAFLAGIFVAGVAPLSTPWLWGLAVILLLLVVYFIQKKKQATERLLFITLLFLAFLLGTFRYQSYTLKSAICQQNGQSKGEPLTLQGIVTEPTQVSSAYGETILELRSFLDAEGKWQPRQGKVLIRLPASFDFPYHTSLTFQGKLDCALPTEAKAHTSWLLRKGISYRSYYPTILQEIPSQKITFKGSLYSLRTQAYQTLQSLLPFPENELLAGILLGLDENIPSYLSEAYRVTGCAHILAISGFNIALIAGVITKFFRGILPYRKAALLSVMVISCYVFFVGAQPPVLRAGIMAIFSIPAYLIGRKVIGIHLLALTAASMAFFNPYLLWDASFQLSMCATFGIFMYTDFFTQKADAFLQKKEMPSKELIPNFIKDSVIITFAAQLATFPVLATQFQEISLISPLVNLLILPMQPALMTLGGMTLLVGLIFYPIGRLLGLLAWLIGAFSDAIVLLFSMIPTTLRIDPTLGLCLGLGINGFLIGVVFQERKEGTVQTGL